MRQYVLVGSGSAALSAVEALRETDPRARITLVSSEPHPFYSRPGLAYFLTGEVPARRLVIRGTAEIADLCRSGPHECQRRTGAAGAARQWHDQENGSHPRHRS
jgi:NADPH-dependent 2,4-dienoyl-CoA reductase/sulfur reductase-like enzyme